MNKPDDYIKLLIYRETSGRDRYLHAPRATADYYGWTQEFEIWRPKILYEEDGHQFVRMPAKTGRGHMAGGKRIRIGRSPSKRGNPAGLTNQFSVSNSFRTIDLAELANFTKVDWYWMEDLSGTRISKEHWGHIYAAGGRIGRRGLVSV